ncbi:TRAP transporter substrate-binding protein [Stappia indica]|uniref:TRAP transporter substrate-binding protein n=1 Tax=Stappia indica TaxID=538381 RepID=UPI001CD5C4E3|nr:TRAP transporter substrate-binding protein [Stappia indica]MCA1300463.1 TRAP transporter substrate-binding protein [Stappia indica]
MKRILLGALGAMALMGGTVAGAQEKAEFNFSHDLPMQHPLHSKGFKVWGDSITAATDGALTFNFYPAGQLGKAKDEYDIARFGIADFVWANPGHTPGRFPIAALGELPFFISDGAGGTRAINEWYQAYADKEMRDVKLCMIHLHDPGTLHTTREVRQPSDLEGLAIRPPNGTIGRLMQANGASSIQVGPSEAREVLERGAADGIAFPWRSIYIFGMDDVTTYHADMPLYVTNFIIAMNKDRYENLSEAHRAVIDAHCTPEWAEKLATGWFEFDREGRQMFVDDPKHTVTELSEADVQQWREASAFLLDEWRAAVTKAGHDADEIYNALVERLDAYDARF